MIRRSRIRPGTSLLEVLVGLGIMAVGAIGAFVLFPLSAINVSRALIDDRTTTCAITADGQMRDAHRRVVETPPYEFYFAAGQGFEAPGPGMGSAAAHEPSIPVFVDPMGYCARTGASQLSVGDNGETGIPRSFLRVTADLVNPGNVNNSLALRFCSQMDGLTFTEGGNVPGGVDMREMRYNWLWVLQRPVQRDRFTVRMQVVVFDKRAHLYAPPGSEAYYGPNSTPAINTITFVPGTTSITGVPNTAEVRKGSWVMDATIDNVLDPVTPTAGVTGAGSGPTAPRVIRSLRHGEFYRVTSVTEVGTSYTLEVHKPIVRADGYSFAARPEEYQYTGALVVMPAVVEVYERPMLTREPQ